MKTNSITLLVFAWFATFTPAVTVGNENAPPPAPTGLTVRLEGDVAALLSWEPSPGATSYTVFRSTTQNDTNAQPIARNLTATSYTAEQLHTDTTYYLRVQALGPGGASDFASEVSVATKVTKVPLLDGTYTIAPKRALGLRLQTKDGSAIVGKDASLAAQQWRLTCVNAATYRLSPVSAPEKALKALEAEAAGACISPYEGNAAQQWTLSAVVGGYRVTPAHASDQALTASATIDGTAVGQAPVDSSSSQIWVILPVSESASDPGTAYVPEGYKLVFGDEFDGLGIDTEKWETLAPYSQHYLNDEIECYEPEAVIVKDGVCILRAEEAKTSCGGRHTWRSGSITSRSTRSDGYYEARIKMPQGQGMWPAFWLTSSKRWPPEWDILEMPHTDGTLYQYLHPIKDAKLTWVDGAAGADRVWKPGEGMPNPYSGFVIYGCLVTPQGVTFWVNGQKTAQWEVSAGTTDPMWVNCGLAVGGKWPGMPDETTPKQCDMIIDYVRVYQK